MLAVVIIGVGLQDPSNRVTSNSGYSVVAGFYVQCKRKYYLAQLFHAANHCCYHDK